MADLTQHGGDLSTTGTDGSNVGTRRILIVNADDFGQSFGINRGVIQAHERGIVTSATLMVRWAAASHAAEYAKGRPGLSLGLHLDLAEWHYQDDAGWLPRYEVAPANDEKAVREEIERQLETFLHLVGRPPTHLDSHQHVHLTPPVSGLLVDTGRRLGVPVRHLAPGLSYNGSFYGQDSRGSPVPAAITVASLVSIIQRVPKGVTELACHPGQGTDIDTAYSCERSIEVATLCSSRVRDALDESGVELRSFAELTWPQAHAPRAPAGVARPSVHDPEPRRSHAFRFAVTAGEVVSGDDWRGICRHVEELGFSAIFVPDHLGNQLGPVPALAAAASHTRSIHLGVLVSCNDFRHPVVYAKDLATLDLLSGGRVEWGMGAGWLESEFAAAGIPFDRSVVRVDRLRESIAVMKALFGDGPATYRGEHYQLASLEGLPKPTQRPHPPLLVGGSGRRTLTLAAQQAQIVGVAPSLTARRLGTLRPSQTVEEAADTQLGWVRQAAGSRWDDIEISMVAFPAVVTGERQTTATTFAAGLGLEPSQVLSSPHVWIGAVEQICEQLLERRERWGVSYWVVPMSAVDVVAPVVARLAGA